MVGAEPPRVRSMPKRLRKTPVTLPRDQQDGVILEGDFPTLTEVLLPEAAEVEGIMLATGAAVVDDQVIMGNRVAFRSVVPEPADILDVLSVMHARNLRSRSPRSVQRFAHRSAPGTGFAPLFGEAATM